MKLNVICEKQSAILSILIIFTGNSKIGLLTQIMRFIIAFAKGNPDVEVFPDQEQEHFFCFATRFFQYPAYKL